MTLVARTWEYVETVTATELERPSAPVLPDGLVVVVKEECECCRMVAPLLGALPDVTVYTQDDPAFPAGVSGTHDADLAVIYHHTIETVPTLLRVVDGVEVERTVGWLRDDWRRITGIADLGAELPVMRPGCGSMSVDPDLVDQLRVRFEGGRLHSRRIELAELEDEFEAIFARGWTDGLPVVPPTERRVLAMLEGTSRAPGEVVAIVPPDLVECTVEKVAINAVLAGCRPEYMPVLIAALEAMADPAFTLHGAITSTGGSATLVVVNGPIRHQLGLNGAGNVFGPGWRANATIGRAVRLITLNCLGAQPGLLDRSTQGHPGKYSYCIAELEEENPWEPLSVTRGLPPGTSAVTVFAAEGPHNVLSHYGETAEAIIVTLADTMASLGSFSPGESFVVLAPEHVAILTRDGWTKPRIREALYTRARRTVADLKRGGKLAGAVQPGDEARWEHRGRGPEDIHIMVAGGGAGGHSAFIPSWSRDRNSLAVTRPIRDSHHGSR